MEGWEKKQKHSKQVPMFVVPARITPRKDVKITYPTSLFFHTREGVKEKNDMMEKSRERGSRSGGRKRKKSEKEAAGTPWQNTTRDREREGDSKRNIRMRERVRKVGLTWRGLVFQFSPCFYSDTTYL